MGRKQKMANQNRGDAEQTKRKGKRNGYFVKTVQYIEGTLY